MKNICIVSECQQILGVGGTETVSYLLKEELKKNGYFVWSAFFIPKTEITETDLLFPKGLDYICSSENETFLVNTVNEKHIDVIMLQGAISENILTLCTNAKRRTNAKLIYTNHFSPFMRVKDYDDYKERVLQNTKSPILAFIKNLYFEIKRRKHLNNSLKYTKEHFLQYNIQQIDAFVSLNDIHTQFLQTIYPKQFHDRFHTISNPICLEEKGEDIKKENIILFVGRLTFQKRLDRLLLIWKDLQDEYQDWKVIVVGDGEYANEYKIIAKQQQLKNIEFVGQQPSEKYFKKSKIICMTSSHESFGMVLIEGQMYGCTPILYNSFEAATDIVQNEHNGLLITPFKKKEYTKALRRLITNETLREKLATNSKESVRKFDITVIIKQWITLIETL